MFERTDGWVIVDFLDAANWDCIAGYDFDSATNNLQLHWHDYRELDATSSRDEIDTLVFPASLYGLFLHLKEILIIRGKQSAVFLIQGYALTQKEVTRHLKAGSEKFKFEQENLFTAGAIRKLHNQWQVFRVNTAPLYTIAIIPKNSGLTSTDSRKLLFTMNLKAAIDRLQTAHDQLDKMEDASVDDVCEKANTIRRVLEYVLKIEICYRELQSDKPYSQLLLGDLLKVLRPYHDDTIKGLFSKLAEWANELSHDTGRPIEKKKASVMALLGMAYVELLKSSIELHPFPPLDEEYE